MSTKQELFDKAARLVLAQGCAAVNDLGACLYDDGNGKHCAIGLLMKDAGVPFPMYNGKVLNGAVDSPHVLEYALPSVMAIAPSDVNVPKLVTQNTQAMRFLSELQLCHDLSASDPRTGSIKPATSEQFLSQFRAAMINFAEKWKLDDKAVRG